MKNETIWALAVCLLTQPLSAQGRFEHCNAFLRYGAQEVTREFSSLHETAYNFELYCGLDSSEMSDSEVIEAGGSIVGVGGGSGSRSVSSMRSALRTWCDEKRTSGTLTEEIRSEAISASRVGQEAWNNCQNAAQKNVEIKLMKNEVDLLLFQIDSDLDAPIFLNDVFQKNFKCVISGVNAGSNQRSLLETTTETSANFEQVIPNGKVRIDSENVQVTCGRVSAPPPQKDDPVKLVYERGWVSINTSVVPMVVTAPEVEDTYFVTPPGAVMAFSIENCPRGWKPFEPAFGRFLRGIDYNSAGVDPDGRREPGHLQEDAFQDHLHSMTSVLSTSHAGVVASNQGFAVGDRSLPITRTNGATGNENFTARHSSETRPKNVAVTFCERLPREKSVLSPKE